MQKFSKARWLYEEAAQRLPDTSGAETLHALLTLAQGGTVDTWPNAVDRLQAQADKAGAEGCEIFNTALLLTRRGRAEAQIYWQKLARQADSLSGSLRTLVCARETCPTPKPDSASVLPWQLPVMVGVSLTPPPEKLRAWVRYPFDFNRKIRGTVYQAPDGSAEVLAFSGESGTYADMVVLKSGFDRGLTSIADVCPMPLRRRESIGGAEIRSCGDEWAVWVENRQVVEIWMVNK